MKFVKRGKRLFAFVLCMILLFGKMEAVAANVVDDTETVQQTVEIEENAIAEKEVETANVSAVVESTEQEDIETEAESAVEPEPEGTETEPEVVAETEPETIEAENVETEGAPEAEDTEFTEVTETEATEDATGEENTEAEQSEATEETPEAEETETEERIRFDYKSEDVHVIVTLQDENDLPEEAELLVTPLEVTADMKETIENTAEENGKTATSITAFDIRFVVDGVEVQPGDTVKVQITLPEIVAGDAASVYHYNEETSEAEDMEAVVSVDGQVEFDTPHFSTYVIVNQGEETVTVTIQHFNYNNKSEKIYADDVRVLTPFAKINDYKKALNWEVVEVTDADGTVIINHDKISAKEDMTIKVYYEPKREMVLGETTFYDYVVRPVEKNGWWTTDKPEQSINHSANFSDPDSGKNNRRLTVGKVDQNASANQYNAIVNGNQNANNYVSGQAGLVKNLVKGLNPQDWSEVEFNVDEPGVFSNKTTVGKTILSDYKLQFERTGDTYELSKILDGKGAVVEDNLYDFFPLDNAASNNVTDHGYQGSHNYFFGMRYDVTFSIGDYVGPLNYSFTGDDDLWVILDGETVVIDLGGIHDALTDSVDLWKVLELKDENGNLKTLTEKQKSEPHRLTILYMERGAVNSTCLMKFTLPSAQILNVTNTTTDFAFHKTNSQGEKLAGATFKLVDDATGSEKSATSDEEGMVRFYYLPEGTYTLKEVAAPDGYSAENHTWKIIVTEADGKLEAKLYEADGKTEVENNTIINRTVQEILESTLAVEKEAELVDWDNRKYQLTLSGESLSSTLFTDEKTIDVMLVVDLSGSMNGNTDANAENDYSPSTKLVGKYSEVVKTLDTNHIYYYGKSDRLTPAVSGENYKYAQNPMKYINGEWKYYSGSKWASIDNNSTTNVYSWASRISALKEAASSFVSGIAAKSPESKVGLASFYGVGSGYNSYTTGVVKEKLNQVSTNETQLLYDINAMVADGGTSPQKALSLVEEQFDAAQDDNEKYVILFTDGEPSEDADKVATERETAALKQEGYIVITVGLGLHEDTEAWLKGTIASSAEYAFTATTVDGLKEIFNNLQNTLTQNASIQGAQIVDVLDNRFELAEGEEERLIQKYGDKISVVKNSDGTTTVTWMEQEILHSEDGGWQEELQIVAKDSFVGGNNIATNVSPDSCITVSGMEAIFPQPTVNVKAEIAVNNNENTIFLGEAVSTDKEMLQKLFDVHAVTGLDGQKLENVDVSKFNLNWYEDEALTNEITIEEMGRIVPVSISDEKEFYLHVTYQVEASTEESNLASTLDGVVYTAGDENNIVEAVNTADRELNYGIYRTEIKDGCITITKAISKDAYRASEGDPIFTFKITNLKNDKVYFRTVRFDVNDEDTKVADYEFGTDCYFVSAEIKNLPQGIYQVEELDTMGFVLEEVTVDADITNCETQVAGVRALCAIGYDMSVAGNSFEMEDYNELLSQNDDNHVEKSMAGLVFTNKKSRAPGKESDTDVIKNSLIIGEICESNSDADNMATDNEESRRVKNE